MFQYQQISNSYPPGRSFNPIPMGATTQGQQLHDFLRLTAQNAPSTNKRSATDTFQPANDPLPQAKRPRTDGRRFHLHIASRQNQPPQQAYPRGPALTEPLPPKCEQPGHPGCQRNSSCRYFNDSVPLRLQWMVHACACHRGQPPPGSQGYSVHYGPAQQCVIPPQASPREQGPGRWNPGGPQYSSRPQLSWPPAQFSSPPRFSLPQFLSPWQSSVPEQSTNVRIGPRQNVPPVLADLTQRNVRERPLSLPGLHPENPIRIVEVNMESYPLLEHSERVRDRLKAPTSPTFPKEPKPDALVNVAMAQLPCGRCYIPGCRHCPELIRQVLAAAA